MQLHHFVDQLEALVRAAKDVPVLGGARVDKQELYGVIDQMRESMGPVVLDEDRVVYRGAGALQPIDELDDLIHDARPVPLTGQVRVDREKLMALVARVRAGAGQDRIATRAEIEREQRERQAAAGAALDRLGSVVEGALPVPLTSQVRLQPQAVREALTELHANAPAELLALAVELERLLDRAQPVPLTDYVRVERDKLQTNLEQMRAVFSQGTPAAPTN